MGKFRTSTEVARPVGWFPGSADADTMAALDPILRRIGARKIIDLGCGDGAIAEALCLDGYQVTGVDPSADAIAKAGERTPSARFICCRAQALPPDLTGFDAAVFVNSLHHVEEDQMQAALLRALAALRRDGLLVVIEPLAQGSFFRAMRPVEDETAIRASAAQAIEALISSGRLVLRNLDRWNRESRFSGLSEFVDYLSRALPERTELARRHEVALARAWRDNIRSIKGKAVLVQPMVCWTLSAPQGHRQ